MKSITLLRAELSRRYAAPDWQTKRRECYEAHGWECAVCGPDWRDWKGTALQAHHTPEGYANLWHEDTRKGAGQLVCLCSRHHPRGRLTLYSIKQWRTSYRWQKRLVATQRLLLRAVTYPFRRLARRIRRERP